MKHLNTKAQEQKPDFYKIMVEVFKAHGLWFDPTGEHAIKARIALCDRIWNDYVVPLQSETLRLTEERDKLQKFKEYVHDRLDKMGIEKDPESVHKEAGCRIGGRLDIVERLKSDNERLMKALRRWNDLNSQLHVATYELRALTESLISTHNKSVTP